MTYNAYNAFFLRCYGFSSDVVVVLSVRPSHTLDLVFVIHMKMLIFLGLYFIKLEIFCDIDAEEHFANSLYSNLSQSLVFRKHEHLKDDFLKLFCFLVCPIENQSINRWFQYYDCLLQSKVILLWAQIIMVLAKWILQNCIEYSRIIVKQIFVQ